MHLAGACAGLFVLMLDSTVVALALPSIRRDIGASAAGLQWMMNVYLLSITVLVVTAGRLGDMFGRKRLFLAGAVVFVRSSRPAAPMRRSSPPTCRSASRWASYTRRLAAAGVPAAPKLGLWVTDVT